ncbi:MAG TPA: hypothetical protein DIW50_04680, partial [Prolixibacteraceae bacterium]|nr:hypothetical protein [Prolixibacteraceae bacterium]
DARKRLFLQNWIFNIFIGHIPKQVKAPGLITNPSLRYKIFIPSFSKYLGKPSHASWEPYGSASHTPWEAGAYFS